MMTDMKTFRETLEQNTPEVLAVVAEWLQTLITQAEKPDVAECPRCGREFIL
jgi:4-hydroxy-3-methylbut-2-en-1-yl diphosphate synthase IspG/GcpE